MKVDKANYAVVKLIKRKLRYLIIGGGLTLIAIGFNLAVPWVMKIIVDQAIPHQNWSLLLYSLFGLILLPIIATLFDNWGGLHNHKIGGFVTDQLRKGIFYKLLHLPPKIYHNFKTGDIAARIYSCGEIGDLYITQCLIPGIFNSLIFISILVIMFIMSWKLSVTVMILLPAMYYLSTKYLQKSRKLAEEVMDLQTDLNNYSQEFVSGLKTVQTFTQEENEFNYQSNWIDSYRKVRNRTFVIYSFSDLLIEGQRSIGLGILFAFGAYQIFNSEMTVGALIAFTVYFPQLFGALEKIQFAIAKTFEYRPKLKLITEIIELEERNDLPSVAISDCSGSIEFQNVTFSYNEGRGEVSDLNFEIKSGEFLGIVGPSGGGKSTILDLIMRFYDPNKGQIFLDGKDLKTISLHDLRNHISLVSQDTFMWNRSIRENLMYAKRDATEEELIRVCKQAQLYDFIEQLPEGFNTVIGERGIKISGGEKQRLAIARSLLRNPKVLLMDEPTSALDARTEALLQKNLQSIFEGKTAVVVAHRLATVRDADRIIVIENGQVHEMGNHRELMENQSVYYRLFNEQYKTS
ncbi:ATP-binding cassette, subfamily B/ATP-binding cassette, subfamily B, MsbA [Seinonella peptonophila]|uniref:ATP-binding cassette, subfamily B/ATP-binding cassette, subfamily B, MsbA n=1 Tax=Seinonella peptonophila TaxID=112248 RepID=A0A1M4VCS7_9BACL|nr:ABC transporter ATP-binding protein [Seinonella peptonophila]SHE66804.1 ATP-binding cassette, subfamily B/ATP-binding cassette, subfamily B, MsbA [Seinonella peptonophila]